MINGAECLIDGYLTEEAQMMWIAMLSALVISVIFIMCLLIVSSRADDQKERIIPNRNTDRSNDDVAFSSSVSVVPEYTQWMSAHSHKNP